MSETLFDEKYTCPRCGGTDIQAYAVVPVTLSREGSKTKATSDSVEDDEIVELEITGRCSCLRCGYDGWLVHWDKEWENSLK